MRAIKGFSQKTFSSLSVRNYRLFFIGQGISQTGTWMQVVALGWLALTVSGSGTQLGLVLALQFVPLLVAAPWGGAIVDRLNKRRILYWTQSLAGILSLLLSILVFTGTTQMWMLYAFALLTGMVKVFDNPARQTFVSEVVGNAHIKNAVSLNSTMGNLARAIGPAVGGVLIAGVGIAFCFLIDALSFIAVIFMLSLMRGEALIAVPPPDDRPSHILDGFRYVKSVPLLSTALIMMAIIGTFAFEFQISLPILAKQTFSGDAATYAALMATYGLGSALGGLYSAGRHAIIPRQLVVFGLLFGASMLVTSSSPTLGGAIFGMLVVGFFSINVSSIANTMVQLESKPQMRGRVMAIWNMAIFGSTPIGGPLIGYIGEHFGARYGLATGGIATIGAALLAAQTLSGGGVFKKVTPETELEVEMQEATDTPKL